MKYIDADKLIAKIERQIEKLNIQCQKSRRPQFTLYGKIIGLEQTLNLVRFLQQEQPDKYETALEKAREWMPNVNQGGHAILIDIFPELGEGLDPRYNGRKQEQPEVDLEKEIKRFLSNVTKMNKGEWRGKYPISDIGFRAVARHFYELGIKARKEE